jgi:hypothetical protein
VATAVRARERRRAFHDTHICQGCGAFKLPDRDLNSPKAHASVGLSPRCGVPPPLRSEPEEERERSRRSSICRKEMLHLVRRPLGLERRGVCSGWSAR